MSPRTTFAELTGSAGRALACAHVRLAQTTRVDDSADQDHIEDAHRDLSVALAQLGRRLSTTPGRTRVQVSAQDALVMNGLDLVGRVRPWAVPEQVTHPAPMASADRTGPVADLERAACLIRAAADLWATHHTRAGQPRSPEAARMRHPSMRGAATREWRTLVTLAGMSATSLANVGSARDPEPASRAGAARDPGPRPGPDPARRPGPVPIGAFPRMVRRHDGRVAPVHLAVARPAIRHDEGAIAELSDRVGRLRHLAWSSDEYGQVSAQALHCLARAGATLGRGAEASLRAAGLTREAECARIRATRWTRVAELLAPLRTPLPALPFVAVELHEVDRLITTIVHGGPDRAGSGRVLYDVSRRFDDVAGWVRGALRSTRGRGDLYVLGRGLPTSMLDRRQELIEARLADSVVPIPGILLARLDSSLRAITSLEETGAMPPAA